MVVFINNTQHEFPSAATVADTLASLQIEASRGVAVAVNNTVLPRSEWAETALRDNDRLTVIRATQGG